MVCVLNGVFDFFPPFFVVTVALFQNILTHILKPTPRHLNQKSILENSISVGSSKMKTIGVVNRPAIQSWCEKLGKCLD